MHFKGGLFDIKNTKREGRPKKIEDDEKQTFLDEDNITNATSIGRSIECQ